MVSYCHQEYIANFTFHDMVFTCPSISNLFYGMVTLTCSTRVRLVPAFRNRDRPISVTTL
jgi:hypothetical protein